MRASGLGRASTLLRRAAEIVEAGDEAVLPSRALLIHGFADATGVATDLIEALLRRRGAVLILDHPPKPEGEGTAWSESSPPASPSASATRPTSRPRRRLPGDRLPRLAALEAVGADAETREVAARIRALLDGGEPAEGIGVVARDLDPYRFALRRHFDRLGIPFSGVGERGGLEPAGRRARALLELLREGETVPSDRWLDAVADLPEERHSPALPQGARRRLGRSPPRLRGPRRRPPARRHRAAPGGGAAEGLLRPADPPGIAEGRRRGGRRRGGGGGRGRGATRRTPGGGGSPAP